MSERLRKLERAVRADPSDLIALRAFADERRRRGDELLPAVPFEHDGTEALLAALEPVEYDPGFIEGLYWIRHRARAAYGLSLPVSWITVQ